MIVYFKLKSFPHFSETFVTSNIIYAKLQAYNIKIVANRFLDLNNSSQQELLKKHQIEQDIIKPFRFRKNVIFKFFQVLSLLANLRVLKYYIFYCFYKKTINLKMLNALYQFKDFKKGLFHIHFNNAIEPIIELIKIGFISPKCIVTFHGYDAFLDSPIEFSKKYSLFYKNHVVAVTTNSYYLRQNIIKLGVNPKLISVIPMGIDTSNFNSKPKQLINQRKLQIITVGRLIQLKGHIYAIKAVKKLKELNYDVTYSVIGDGASFKKLSEYVQEHDLKSSIDFKGAMSQNEIVNYLSDSDIFIMPSTYDNKSKRREAFGLVSIEAQAMGLPVVGFNSGGFPETLINGITGFAVKDRDVDGLVERIEFLINNKAEYNEMSKAAIKHASKFDHRYTTKKYLELYEQYS